MRKQIRKYCVQKNLIDCDFEVYFRGEHNGGGPVFIKNLFGTEYFLNKHKDCKSVLEVCSGPGFIGWYLYKHLNMNSVHFLDIHEPVKEDLKLTAEANNEELNFYHSDGFKNYDGPKVDLIVMNPPFFHTDKQFEQFLEHDKIKNEFSIRNSKRIAFDKDFKLHDNLINNYEKHLTDTGRIVFLAFIDYVPREMIESKISYKGDYKEHYIFFDKKWKLDEPNFYTLTYYKQVG